MAEGAYGRWGIARTYALIFGIAYLGVALTEAIAQEALSPVLEFTGIQNAIHWIVGTVVLLSFFGSEATAKSVARVIGVVFVAITVFGFVAPETLGELLGFDGAIPVAYNVVHALTAAVALYAGFATRSSYGRAATA
jgi:predicted permease